MTIRRQPEDFIVNERLSGAYRATITPDPPGVPGGAGASGFAIYKLTKASLSTPEAIQAMGAALGVRHATIGYAGLKDKHARTVQHIAAPFTNPQQAARLPQEISGKHWSAQRLGWSRRELTAAAIDGNGFEIVVRDISAKRCDEMRERAALLAIAATEASGASGSGSLLIVNYFGDQRFGSARHGGGFAGRRLIEGDFEEALRLLIATPSRKDTGKTREFRRVAAQHWGDWKGLAQRLPRCPERAAIELLARCPEGDSPDFRAAFAALPYFLQTMSVEAYQSHLWNDTARRIAQRLTRQAAESRGQAAIIEAPDPFGPMLFPAAALVPDAWRYADMPLLASKTELIEPWGACAEETLAAEGVKPEQLRIPGLRRPFFGEAPRPLFITAMRYTMTQPEADELTPSGKRLKVTIGFDLPRGSYATVVLRALGQ